MATQYAKREFVLFSINLLILKFKSLDWKSNSDQSTRATRIANENEENIELARVFGAIGAFISSTM